jgi:hypothetical protein
MDKISKLNKEKLLKEIAKKKQQFLEKEKIKADAAKKLEKKTKKTKKRKSYTW